MADPRASRKSYCVTRLQTVERAVDPDIGMAFQDIDKFFLSTFSMRVRRSTSGRKALMMNADPRQSKQLADRRADGEKLVAVGLVAVVGLLQVTPMAYEIRSLAHFGS